MIKDISTAFQEGLFFQKEYGRKNFGFEQGLFLDTKAAKYLNSPESNAYSKGEVLYGLYEAKKAMSEDSCYLVEGYTDVIQMYQKGIENVVLHLEQH